MTDLHARLERLAFKAAAPAADAAILALGQVAEAGGLEKDLLELVKLRASQMNGCAFCVQHHLTIARKLAVPSEKLDLVVVWREVDLFSARERAALGWTEALTDLIGTGAPDSVYAAARESFSETELALLTAAIGAINVWNRLAVAYRFTPHIPNRREPVPPQA